MWNSCEDKGGRDKRISQPNGLPNCIDLKNEWQISTNSPSYRGIGSIYELKHCCRLTLAVEELKSKVKPYSATDVAGHI